MTLRALLVLLAPVAACTAAETMPPRLSEEAVARPALSRADSKQVAEVWVVLDTAPNGDVKQQQDAVMSQLRGLGATELARVVHARNAVAITVDATRLDEIRRIPGVRSVAPVQHVEREPRPAPPPSR